MRRVLTNGLRHRKFAMQTQRRTGTLRVAVRITT